MNKSRLGTTAAGAVLLLLLLLQSMPTLAASCTLTVTPGSGTPGTRFTFKGSGFTPTQLRLTQDNHAPKVVPLQLNGADPFQFSIVASEGDVGNWRAVAVATGGCRASASLHVTMPPTATDDPVTQDRQPIVLAITGLGALFGVVTIVMIRRSRRFGASV